VLAQARASLNKYQKDVARLEPLAEKKAIPQQDLDNAIASVAVGEANVLSAEAQVKSAELDLGYCDVRAPISGLIGAKQVSVGSLVGKGEPTLLATISQLDPIWFYCAISEVDYLRAERKVQETGRRLTDVPLTLILADGSEHPDPGKWVFIDRAVDVKTGTIRARAEFPNAGKVLRPGMFSRIRIVVKTEQDSILVPERALVELQGKNFLWVVGDDNKASQRPVQVSPNRIGPNAVVIEGVKVGERIVVEGLQKLREGAPVQPMTAAQMAEAARAAKQSEASHAGEGTAQHGKE
jgi:membrane fusion protein (multidrug efflux system)